MDISVNERIFKPVLEIAYEEMPTSMIGLTTKASLTF